MVGIARDGPFLFVGSSLTEMFSNPLSSCCASRFTWASTSDSEAQEARDKHNCRSCGTLVCDPCSRNRIPIPSIGISLSARVCDRCYHDMGGAMTSSFVSSNGEESNGEMGPVRSAKPERRRKRRSAVVDELASRVQSSTQSGSSGSL